MTLYESTVDTQFGPFTLVVDDEERVLASGWTGDVDELLTLIHPRLRETVQHRRELGAATRAAQAYHDGQLDAPAAVEVRQRHGGAFLGTAWQQLRLLRPGEQVTYAQLATRTGNPAAVRAAAQACARNAAALFVPCHRVIRTDGGIGGFRWGIEVKELLAKHESS